MKRQVHWLWVIVWSITLPLSPVIAAPHQSAVSTGLHSLAIQKDGTLWAWGWNSHGQLGLGDTLDRHNPTRVGTDSNWVAVAAGTYHSLGLKSDGTLWAWGFNAQGQLGLGSTTEYHFPQQVAGNTWVAVAAGSQHSFAIKAFGRSIWAWGFNAQGQLGLGDTTQRTTPALVPGSDWVAVAAGDLHSLGITSDGTLYAWGRNNLGQLGLNDTTNRNTPTKVTWVGGGWMAAVAGSNHSLGLKSNSQLYAWGSNDHGQLGQGDTADRNTPTPVIMGGVECVAMAAGDSHSLALRPGGALYAWGNNGSGQLGTGNNLQQVNPILVGNFGFVTLFVTEDSSMGLKADGSLWSWGDNYDGQLGLGDTSNRNSPRQVPGFNRHTAVIPLF
jgi:alpha-tubulin suppressor-like RCC1 family protein